MRARLVLLAAVTMWTLGSLPGWATQCPPGEGTTVVVDFAGLGGGVVVECAPTASTGFEALAEAGFQITRVQENPAFLCRIDGLPSPEEEDCVDIPPQSAFWSYWTAERGGEWRFNTSGAGGSVSGDLEGWSFSSGSSVPPDFGVPPAPTTTTTTTTTTTSSTTTTTSTSTTTTTTTVPAPATTEAVPPSTISTTTSTVPETSTSSTIPTTSITTESPTSLAAATTTSDLPDDGSRPSAGLLIGMAAAAGVGTVALVMARRRGGR
ncbi:MAG: hypothetical protein ACLFWM_07505 [Actinomycetota bacterium]